MLTFVCSFFDFLLKVTWMHLDAIVGGVAIRFDKAIGC